MSLLRFAKSGILCLILPKKLELAAATMSDPLAKLKLQ